MKTIFFKPYEVMPENFGPDAEVGVLSRLSVQEPLKLGRIILKLLGHKQPPYTLVFTSVILGQPHVPLQAVCSREGTNNENMLF
jgi:hypothetical protein